MYIPFWIFACSLGVLAITKLAVAIIDIKNNIKEDKSVSGKAVDNKNKE